MVGPEDVLEFWLDKIGPKGWYKEDAALDARIFERFQSSLEGAIEGRYSLWLTYPTGTLAYIVLTDQLSRNMYRGTGQAFASDKLALAAAKSAVQKGWDLKVDEPARQFFYLPMMHSECLSDQEQSVRLICERMPETKAMNLPHARAHREVIRQFGRFPYRNAALARDTTQAEAAYLATGGYGETLRMLDAKKAS
ncbi:MAG: DUF924 family protein [Aliishimia sp.]